MAAVAPCYGGPSGAIWPMVSALHTVGVTVELVTTDADGPHRQLKKSDLPKVPFPVHVLPGPGESHVELAQWTKVNAKRFDVIHTHGLWHRHGSAAMAAARHAGVPHIIRTCGMLAPYSWNRRWWKKRPYWWLVERRNVRGAAALHVTTPGERAEVEAWHLPGSHLRNPAGLRKQRVRNAAKRLGTSGPFRPICEAGLKTLKESGFVKPAGVDAIWQALNADPHSQLWSRALTLVAIGDYMTRHLVSTT